MDYQEDTLAIDDTTGSDTDTISISVADLAQSNRVFTNNWNDTILVSNGIYDANCNVMIGGTGGSQYPNVATTLGGNISPGDNIYSIFNDDTLRAPSGKLSLTGDNADIEINGESIVGMLREIRDRLSIIQVSEEMEAEWDDLADLRRQYEAKLAECREKSKMWDTLKRMPAPEIE